MKLRPLDTPDLVRLVAGWLSRKENCQWLDFGDGRRQITPEWLRIMTQRESHVLRVFTAGPEEVPIGVVGLSEVDRGFGTARIWLVVGDKSFGARGYGTAATLAMLDAGFRELGLHAINTWIVEHNPSLRIAERCGFRMIGRQRQCHRIDGRPYDRLWLDILSSEHKEHST